MSLLFWLFIPDRPSNNSADLLEGTGELGENHDVSARESEAKKNLSQIVREPYLMKYFFVLFTFDIAFWGFTTWLPTYLVKARGFSMAQMGVAASLPFVAGTVGCICGGWVSDRYFSTHRRMPILTMQLMSAVLLYLTFVAKSVTILMICQSLAGFCLAAFFSAFWAMPMNTVPKKLMGIASGFINMAGQIAAFLSPVLIGFLVGAAEGSYEGTFTLLIASIFVSFGIAITLPGRFPSTHDEAAVRN
jgi:sugar phosphate permease